MTETDAKMDADELGEAMGELGLLREDLAVLTGKTTQGIYRWQHDYGEVKDRSTVVLLRLLRDHPRLLKEAWKHAGMPGGRQVTRGRPRKK